MTDRVTGAVTGPTAGTADQRRAAWTWTRHLRAGGSTRWSDWTTPESGTAPPPDWVVPGAAQLELVRRLAARRALPAPGFAALADLVASRSGPGRGPAPQPLSWPTAPGAAGPRFGAPPVDPADVGDEELVRVAVGVLTELLLAAPASASEPAAIRRRRLTRTPAFELAGAPVTTSAVRRSLGLAGHAEGGRSPRVVLLAEPFDESLSQVWSARVQRGAPVRWHGFVERWSARPELPPSADLPGLARLWAARVGAEQVHVVVAPADADAATRAVAAILGVHLEPRTRTDLPPRCQALSPAAVDGARRVGTVLRVRADERRGAAVLGALAADLARRTPSPVPRLTVPEPFADWARARAVRMTGELSAGGYPVHGDLDRVVPRPEGRPTHPRLPDVLDVVMDACLDRAGTQLTRTEGV